MLTSGLRSTPMLKNKRAKNEVALALAWEAIHNRLPELGAGIEVIEDGDAFDLLRSDPPQARHGRRTRLLSEFP